MATKADSRSMIESVNDIINTGRRKGIIHLYTEDALYNGRTIKIDSKELINFSSCSYLGLEIDERLKAGAVEAIRRYGIQFSSSRSYLSCTLYTEWESLIQQMFNAPVILPPTTTLGHYAVIPIAIEEGDAIILDQQVHASVQEAALKMQLKGIPINIIRHNNMDELDEKITELGRRYNKIWFLCDGVFSMYGDFTPIDTLMRLQQKHKQLYLYIDDAHGMSIMGTHGTGFIMSRTGIRERMIIAVSFAKAYGAGGAAIVFSDEHLARKVKNCGGPMVFSGPHQIPVIGAGIASAKIHLSDEIYVLQQSLNEKLAYCQDLLEKFRLPVISNPQTPIFFIGLGLTRVGYNMTQRIVDEGCFVNLGIFPAVSETCTGIRFTITNHHTFADIEKLTKKLAYHFPKALQAEGRSINDVYHAFRRVAGFKFTAAPTIKKRMDTYHIQRETTIKNIPEALWNDLLGNKGAFDWQELNFLEKTFRNNPNQEHNWDFYYYIIWDTNKQPVLATFFTHCLVKDDMFSASSVSEKIERQRLINPYYLCSSAFIMGCLLSEGQHLYIDRSRVNWKSTLMLLLDAIWKEQHELNANTLMLRDFDASDVEIQEFLLDQGFIKMLIPDKHDVQLLLFDNEQAFIRQLKSDKRYYIRKKVLNYQPSYDVKISRNASEERIDQYYQLYKNVAERSFELNTFHLPRFFFKKIFKLPQWEVIELSLKLADSRHAAGSPVGIALCYKTKEHYYFLITGMDYDYLDENIYPQILWQTVLRANELKLKSVHMGFTASQNKRKFGAHSSPQVAFIQVQDKYNMSVINAVINTGEIPDLRKRQEGIKGRNIVFKQSGSIKKSKPKNQ